MPTAAEESIVAFHSPYYTHHAERPKERTLKEFLYDSKTNQYCGRSVDSWGKLHQILQRITQKIFNGLEAIIEYK